jgi:hypothetical protein
MSLDRAAPLVPDRAPRRPDNLRGLLLMALAFFVFAAADTQAKFLTGWFHPMQIVRPPLYETAGPRNHRSNGPEAGHALTFKLDHSMGADHQLQTPSSQWTKDRS